MTAFDLDVTNPFRAGMTGEAGGPGQGGHHGPNWYEEFGNDLTAPSGTMVYSVFDGKITKVDSTHIASRTGPAYGAGVFVRAATDVLDPAAPGGVGGYYTHVKHLASGITEGAFISRGDEIGKVVKVPGIASHLHFAIAERRNGTNFGINIFRWLLESRNSTELARLTFLQNGQPPQIEFPVEL